MSGIAFDFEPAHHIQDLASLSLKFPSYQMPRASIDAPMMMFADAVAADVVEQSLHFAAVVGDAAAIYEKFILCSLAHVNDFIFHNQLQIRPNFNIRTIDWFRKFLPSFNRN